MAGWVALAVTMVLVGALAGAPGVLLVAVLTLGYASMTAIWTRTGATRVEYRRHLSTDRAVAGDDIGLDVTIWNRKRLPLPWVSGEDRVPERLSVRERNEMPRDEQWPATLLLRNDWALGWYERVIRHFHLDSVRRGAYRFGPASLGIRDVVGRLAVEEQFGERDSLVVAPAMAELRHPDRESAPLGERRTRHSLTVDPSLYAGVRPFQPGDSLRLVHWRATARIGRPVSRRLEPARGREVVLVVDVQTVDDHYWLSWDEDAFESLCVIAASVARRLLDEGASVGAAAANFAGSPQLFAWLPPRASLAQLPRIGELLARIGPVPSAPLGMLLGWLAIHAPSGSSLLLLSTRDPSPFLAALRRARQLGFGVELIAAGPEAAAHAQSARLAKIPAQTAVVEPSWETPRAVALAG